MAELLDDWIQCVIQAVDPWLSSKDIDRGSLWFSEISDQLANTSIGIVCLTKQNKDKPWILFESGALAKGLSANRVCTFLIDLDTSDIENPLAQFNHTFPDKESIWTLVRTINSALGEGKLKETILSKVFETYFPQFEKRFKEILKTTPEEEVKTKRRGDEIMLEVLSSVRMLEKRLRVMEDRDNIVFRDQADTLKKPSLSNTFYFRRVIREHVDNGLSQDVIIDLMSEKVSSNFVRREIDRYLLEKQREVQN